MHPGSLLCRRYTVMTMENFTTLKIILIKGNMMDLESSSYVHVWMLTFWLTLVRLIIRFPTQWARIHHVWHQTINKRYRWCISRLYLIWKCNICLDFQQMASVPLRFDSSTGSDKCMRTQSKLTVDLCSLSNSFFLYLFFSC